jgi:hypothetical protein
MSLLGKLSGQRGTITNRRLTIVRSGKLVPFYTVKLKTQEGGKVTYPN